MPALGDPLQQARKPRLVGLREAGRGLVEQQHLGVERERARDLDQAPVDMREIGGAGVAPAGIAAEVEQLGGAAARVVGAQAGCAEQRAEPAATGRQGDVLLHAQAAEKLRGLVGAGDAGAGDPPGAAPAQRLRAEGERSGAGAVVAAQHVEGGGLAGAVRSDERGDPRRRCRHRQRVDGAQAAELHRQRRRFQPQARPRREARPETSASRARRRPSPATSGGGRGAAGRPRRRARSRAPTSSIAPNTSRRTSSKLESSSGSTPTTIAPTSGPATEPAPPIMTTSTNRIDCTKPKVCGVTKPASGANRPPAAPAHSGRDREGRALDRHRVEADRFGRGLRVAHRAHRRAPGAAREPGIAGEGDAGCRGSRSAPSPARLWPGRRVRARSRP